MLDRAVAVRPDDVRSLSASTHQRRHLFRWDGLAEDETRVLALLREGTGRVSPFELLAMSSTPGDQLPRRCRLRQADDARAGAAVPPWPGAAQGPHPSRLPLRRFPRARGRASRSPTCSSGTTARASRSIGYSFGRDDGSAMRGASSALRPFRRCPRHGRSRGGARASATTASTSPSISSGYTEGARRRSSATAGAGAGELPRLSRHDGRRLHRLHHRRRRVVPPSSSSRISCERIVHLPDCYQPNDATRDDRRGARRRAPRLGCPSTASCSAASTTATRSRPASSTIWMRLLRAVPGSVLWLPKPTRR